MPRHKSPKSDLVPASQSIAKIRVLIVDDHAIVREGLASIIRRQPDMELVGDTGSGTEALGLFRQHMPDVLVLDLRLPDLDGFEIIELLCREFPSTARILVLTTYDTAQDIHLSLKSGARGFLLKDTPREEILHAIRETRLGNKAVPTSVAAKIIEQLQYPVLTPREAEVLHQMALGRSNKEIGVALNISSGTAKTHVNSIISKLGADGRTEAVTQAVKRGLIRLT